MLSLSRNVFTSYSFPFEKVSEYNSIHLKIATIQLTFNSILKITHHLHMVYPVPLLIMCPLKQQVHMWYYLYRPSTIILVQAYTR